MKTTHSGKQLQDAANWCSNNKIAPLPRGMLLIDGDASQQTVNMIEDYLAELMSWTPSAHLPASKEGEK